MFQGTKNVMKKMSKKMSRTRSLSLKSSSSNSNNAKKKNMSISSMVSTLKHKAKAAKQHVGEKKEQNSIIDINSDEDTVVTNSDEDDEELEKLKDEIKIKKLQRNFDGLGSNSAKTRRKSFTAMRALLTQNDSSNSNHSQERNIHPLVEKNHNTLLTLETRINGIENKIDMLIANLQQTRNNPSSGDTINNRRRNRLNKIRSAKANNHEKK